MQGRTVLLRAWRFDVIGVTGHIIPVFLLDTDVEGNDPWDRHLTDHLYGGDTYYRLCQETILGLGGIAMLNALGCKPEVYHMNEGHAALLDHRPARSAPQRRPAAQRHRGRHRSRPQAVRLHHPHARTRRPRPVRPRPDVPDPRPRPRLHHRSHRLPAQRPDEHDVHRAASFSRYVNGVAMQHGIVSQQMFPDYKVHAITNGVHAATWLSEPFQQLLDAQIPAWRTDNQYFRSVYGIAPADIAATHRQGKLRLFAEVAERTGQQFDPNILTLGFARRVATYKRANLLFHDRSAPRRASPKRSAACRSCSPAKPIPPTTPARASSARSSPPPTT